MNDVNKDDPTGERDVDQLLAELEPHERPPKCAWVPSCGPAFGRKSREGQKREGKARRLRDCVGSVINLSLVCGLFLTIYPFNQTKISKI